MSPTWKPRRGSVTVVTLAANNQEILSPSEKRRTIAFMFGSGNSGTVDVNNRALSSAGDGIALNKNTNLMIFTYEDFGTLVSAPWSAWASHAGDTLTVIEGLEI